MKKNAWMNKFKGPNESIEQHEQMKDSEIQNDN